MNKNGVSSFQREEQHQQTAAHGAEHIPGHLAHDQLFGVAQDDADAAEEAVFRSIFLIWATASSSPR